MRRLLCMAGVLFLACSPKAKALPYPVTEPNCPVCKMSFYETQIMDTLTYQGKLYGFCSIECKKHFIERHSTK